MNFYGYPDTSQTLVDMTLFIVALLLLDALLITYLTYPSIRRLRDGASLRPARKEAR